MRQIALDTETTGLEVQAGHRIIEIACITSVLAFLEASNRAAKRKRNRFDVASHRLKLRIGCGK